MVKTLKGQPLSHSVSASKRANQPGIAGLDTGTALRGMMEADWGRGPQGGNLPLGSVVSTARVVVVEDNPSDVFLLKRALTLQDFAFELIHLESGAEALAFIRREGEWENAAFPSLILVDLNLARYTGEDILREIRGTTHLAGVPVCVWSSSQSRRDEALLKSLGVAKFITKPSGLNQFMAIGKVLKDLILDRRAGA